MASNTTLSIIVAIIVMLLVMGVLSFAFASVGDETRETGKGLFGFLEDFKEIFRIGTPRIAIQSLEIKEITSDRIMLDATLRRAEGYIITPYVNGVDGSPAMQTDDSRLFTMENIQISIPGDYYGEIDFTLEAVKDEGSGRRIIIHTQSFSYVKPSLSGFQANQQSLEALSAFVGSNFCNRDFRDTYSSIECTGLDPFSCKLNYIRNALNSPSLCKNIRSGVAYENNIYVSGVPSESYVARQSISLESYSYASLNNQKNLLFDFKVINGQDYTIELLVNNNLVRSWDPDNSNGMVDINHHEILLSYNPLERHNLKIVAKEKVTSNQQLLLNKDFKYIEPSLQNYDSYVNVIRLSEESNYETNYQKANNALRELSCEISDDYCQSGVVCNEFQSSICTGETQEQRVSCIEQILLRIKEHYDSEMYCKNKLSQVSYRDSVYVRELSPLTT